MLHIFLFVYYNVYIVKPHFCIAFMPHLKVSKKLLVYFIY